MQSEITVIISHQDEVVFSSTKTAQSMKEEGYQQPDLQTDNEPLPKLKEGELLLLSASIEVILKTTALYVEDEGRNGKVPFPESGPKGGRRYEAKGAEGKEAKSVP